MWVMTPKGGFAIRHCNVRPTWSLYQETRPRLVNVHKHSNHVIFARLEQNLRKGEKARKKG